MRDAADNTPRTHLFPDGSRPMGGGLPVNERPYRGCGDSRERVRTVPQAVEEPGDDESPGYVIHLPVRVDDLASATGLARMVAVSLGFLWEIDAGETTVSTIDDQNNRHRVFCDLLLPDRSRCPQRVDHLGPCGAPGSP